MLEQLRDIVERPGLGNLHLVEQARHCLAQSPAKQRVVVRNNETRRITHTLHLRLSVAWGRIWPLPHQHTIISTSRARSSSAAGQTLRFNSRMGVPATASVIWVDFAV